MRTVAFYSIDGVSKAKTQKAILVQRGDGQEAWIPLSQASVRFTGPNFRVRVSVPDWFFNKISWKQPVPYVKKTAAPVSVKTGKPAEPSEPLANTKKKMNNPYVGMDFGNMMEEQMVLSEMLDHKRFEYGDMQDSDDPTILDPLWKEIKEIENALLQIADAMKVAMK